MPVLQPNTSKIVATLSASLEAGKLLVSDIEKQKLLREVRALPVKYQSLALEGLIVLLDGQIPRGLDSIEQSLMLYPTDPVTWGNYSSALSNMGLYSKQREILIRALAYDFPILASHAFHFGAFWADGEILKMGYEKLERYKQSDIVEVEQLKAFRVLVSLDDKAGRDLKMAGDALMLILEDEHLKAKGSNLFTDGEGYISLSVSIDTDDHTYLSYLNDKVIDAMIEKGLETGNSLAFFEVAN